MGKAAVRKRTTKFKGDPVLDQLAVIDARGMLMNNLIGMGWRLAIAVLLPLFIGVQLDKKFGTEPSLTLAAFFLAIFGASYLIYNTFNEMQREQLLEDNKKAKRKTKRGTNA